MPSLTYVMYEQWTPKSVCDIKSTSDHQIQNLLSLQFRADLTATSAWLFV